MRDQWLYGFGSGTKFGRWESRANWQSPQLALYLQFPFFIHLNLNSLRKVMTTWIYGRVKKGCTVVGSYLEFRRSWNCLRGSYLEFRRSWNCLRTSYGKKRTSRRSPILVVSRRTVMTKGYDKKRCNTRTSQEVTHPSTTLAQARLTAEFWWDPVH